MDWGWLMSLDYEQLAAAKEPLARARSMPAGFYTDPGVFAAERERLFLKHWFFLTRAEELPTPGDYRAFDSPGRDHNLAVGDRSHREAVLAFLKERP